MKIQTLNIPRFQQQGFTLIELSMVIAVVGLLLSFGVTSWMSMKTSQQIAAANATLRTAARCLTGYVIHSEKIPPHTYFTTHCTAKDPWGQNIIYYNNGDNRPITGVTTKIVRDMNGDHPDGAWLLVSSGPDTTITTNSTASRWDCTPGDDLCHTTSKNRLLYEINK